MDQVTQEGIERFKAAMERVRSGESASEELVLASGRVRLTPDETTPTGIKIEALVEDPTEGASRDPDPKTKEFMERLKGISERMQSGELDSAEISLPSGGTMHFRRDQDVPGAFTMLSSEGGPTLRSVPLHACAARPPDYPKDLPFLSGCPAGLTEMGEGPTRTLTWFAIPDPEASLRELRVQLTADGWKEAGESKASMSHGTMLGVGFEKGEMGRMVTLKRFGEHSQITLLEHPKRKREAGD